MNRARCVKRGRFARKATTGHLEVNFAPDLVRLLREAKYFLALDLEIPELAKVSDP